MTRARDELVLTHAADYGGRRARRMSPSSWRPWTCRSPWSRPWPRSRPRGSRSDRRPLRRSDSGRARARDCPDCARPIAIGTSDGLSPVVGARRAGSRTCGRTALAELLPGGRLPTCPLKYKYVHVLRVPIAPHHSIVYGSALHQAVQEFHRRQARGYVMTEDELIAAFERAWSNEGFLTASTRRPAWRRDGPRFAVSERSSCSQTR